jgi:hypothetical protein
LRERIEKLEHAQQAGRHYYDELRLVFEAADKATVHYDDVLQCLQTIQRGLEQRAVRSSETRDGAGQPERQ